MEIHTDKEQIKIEIQNERTFSLAKGENVLSVLIAQGLFDTSHCGGHGTCGKCEVRFLSGSPLPKPADRRRFTPQQLREGWRLACMAKPQQDCVIALPERQGEEFILDKVLLFGESEGVSGDETVILADLGTTTIVLMLVEKKTGRILEINKEMNPQRKYGADVISRMEHAMEGKNKELSDLVNVVIDRAITEWKTKGHAPDQIILAGNTVMTHLLMNYDISGLSRAPFKPVTTMSVSFESAEINGITVPGISAFVGGDIVAGMLVCKRLMQAEKVSRALLIDLGTNGEMALISPEGNLCTATAAGPAFEGGFGGRMYGADVIAAVAELRRKEVVDETGLMAQPYFSEGYEEGEVQIRQEDIRALQVAKAAVFAGIRILLEEAGISAQEIERVYLAGGFGYMLSVEAACDIGLIPAVLGEKTIAIGNAALSGAYLYGCQERTGDSDQGGDVLDLQDPVQELIQNTRSINLAEKEHFNDYYLQAMSLREERDFS